MDSATKAEEVLAEHDEERPSRVLTGVPWWIVGIGCGIVSAYVLTAVFVPIPQGTQYYLTLFLAAVLPLVFLSYRGRRSSREQPGVVDWVLAAVSLVVALYPLVDFDGFLERKQSPTMADLVAGLLLTIVVLEACRRTTGWWLPIICVVFLAYAYYGGLLPEGIPLSHVGFDFDEIIVALSMGTSGFYGIPLDVAATYIVLFTIYGAVLDKSGASKFFIDLSFAAFRKSRTAPGRTVTLAGFLLGTVSGSGTATTVSLGSVSWPVLRRAGYPKDEAGGVLAAAGIGAILSPPTLGAAAFIIAELMKTSYLTVLIYAMIPTILYYVGIILAIELDARRRPPGSEVSAVSTGSEVSEVSALRLLLRFGYHLLSLVLIVVFMAVQIPPFRAVVYATVIQIALSYLDRENRMTLRRIAEALSAGTRNALPVVAVCAAAGVITAVVNLTALGLDLSSMIVDVAQVVADNPTVVLLLTALLSAIAVSILGLALPVTASFVVASVIIAPALTGLGTPDAAAYMFIFYYSVLSEVSPPTALAAVAASAITGGDPIRTMWATWRYALPAFLVPFAFVLTDNGRFLLGQGPILSIFGALLVSIVAVYALATATSGQIVRQASWIERITAAAAALLLLYLQPVTIAIGLALLAVSVAVHVLRTRSTSLV